MRQDGPGSGSPPRSLSARRAWIEIAPGGNGFLKLHVALREESVDRNTAPACTTPGRCRVALREESVDRNVPGALNACSASSSLSARRAWIEIQWQSCTRCTTPVALREESVDRNGVGLAGFCGDGGSLSARRAWIEIARHPRRCRRSRCRSPRGERG